MGISIDSKIFSNFPFLGGRVNPRGIANIAYNIRNMNIYGLGMGISIVLRYSVNFPFLGGGVNPSPNAPGGSEKIKFTIYALLVPKMHHIKFEKNWSSG